MLSSPGSTPSAWSEGWGSCTAPAHLVCTDVDPGGAAVLLDHLGQDALEQGQGVGDMGVEAVGEALNLTQVLVLLVLEDELQGGTIRGVSRGNPWDLGRGAGLAASTSTWPKVCTRGTTSSLCCSASCWIRSMSSSLGGKGQAQQGMPGQRTEHGDTLSPPPCPLAPCPHGPTHVCTLLRGTNIDVSGQEAVPSSTAWHSDRGYRGHEARWVTPSPWHSRTCGATSPTASLAHSPASALLTCKRTGT